MVEVHTEEKVREEEGIPYLERAHVCTAQCATVSPPASFLFRMNKEKVCADPGIFAAAQTDEVRDRPLCTVREAYGGKRGCRASVSRVVSGEPGCVAIE